MRRIVWIWMTLCAMCLQAQTVTNVVAEQIGNTVVIRYDLDKAAFVSLSLSRDGGATYLVRPQTLSGDIGFTSLGHKKIIWNLIADGEEWNIEQARFKVEVLDEIRILVKNVILYMTPVVGGTFTMGCTPEQDGECDNDESPAHSVTVSDYFIGQSEVTQDLWKAVMGGTTIRHQRDKANPHWSIYGEGGDYPMYYINWDECQEFISKLNAMLSSQLGGMHFALPTEAQWEYAARGGNKSRGYKYSGSSSLDRVSLGQKWQKESWRVNSMYPNELGIYGMSGNVSEWCQDWYGKYSSSPQINPQGPSSGSGRVFRGGNWCSDARGCRVANRSIYTPSRRFRGLGFRLVLQ